jgi:outer membrane protein
MSVVPNTRRWRGADDVPRGPPPRGPVALRAALVLLACCLLAGCWRQGIRARPEVSPRGIHQRIVALPPIEPALVGPDPGPADHQVRLASHEAPGLTVLFDPGTIDADPARFSLPDAIAFAMQYSPRLRAARARIEQSRGLRQVAFAPYLPEVDFESRYVATSGNLSPGAPGITGGVLATNFDTHSFGQTELSLQWTVCDFGRTTGRYGRAVSLERITELQLTRASQTTEFDVTNAYLAVLAARAGRLVQEQSERTSSAVLDDTRHIREGGAADLDDVLRGEVQLSETREAVVTAWQIEYDALARLNYAMGRNAGQPVSVVDIEAEPTFTLSLVDCLQIAAAQRREVAIARLAVAAAQQGYQAASADFLPRIFVIGSVGRVDGMNVANGFQEGAGIHLDQSLYSGGRKQGEARAAKAEIDLAVAEAQSVLDGVSLEVNLAYRAIAAARQRIVLARVTIKCARENLRLVRVKYANGDATPTDMVDAEAAATRSALRLHAAVYGYLSALARLQYAMGTPQELAFPVAAGVGEDTARGADAPELLPPPRPPEHAPPDAMPPPHAG